MGATATATTIKGTLNVVEAVTLDTTLDVTGITTLTGDLNIEGDIDMATGKKLTWVNDNQSISGTATGITIETDDTLQLNADTSVTMDAPSVVFTSTTSEKPLFEIVNAANDATGSHLRLANKRGSNNGANADVAGTVDFFTNNDAQNNQGFAEVKVVATSTTSGSEQGTMTIGVACTDNGGIDTVLTIAGGTNAAGSTTTIAGNLNVIGAAGATNIVFGTSAGSALADGAINNVIIGQDALNVVTTGDNNTAIGFEALKVQNAGIEDNVAVGSGAGVAITTGTKNVIMGKSAAAGATTSDNCVVIGEGTCAATMTGNDNVVVGQAAGAALLAGADNVFIGQAAGNTATTGSTNVCVGNDADVSGTGATNQTAIGAGVTCQADNQVVLGNSSVTDVFMAQDKGATVHCAGINVGVPIVMADSGAVDLVHATHSGRILVLPIVGQNSTLNLPTPTTPFGQHYHFIYGGTSVETHQFIIRTKTTDDSVLIQGSINWTDSHGGGAAIANGTEALTIHNAGAIDVHFVAASASLWYVWGAINADTTPAWST